MSTGRTCVGVRPPPCGDLLLWIHSRKLRKAIRSQRCKAPVSTRWLVPPFYSACLIISSDWWWSVCPPFKSESEALLDTKCPPPPFFPKCKFVIIMISATICAISTHLSSFAPMPSPHASIEPHPASEKTPFKAGAAARGETCVPAEWISCFSRSLLLHNLIFLQGFAKVSMKKKEKGGQVAGEWGEIG